jgi:hypothetical protein
MVQVWSPTADNYLGRVCKQRFLALESKMESNGRARMEKSLCSNGLLQRSIPPAPAKTQAVQFVTEAGLSLPSFPGAFGKGFSDASPELSYATSGQSGSSSRSTTAMPKSELAFDSP